MLASQGIHFPTLLTLNEKHEMNRTLWNVQYQGLPNHHNFQWFNCGSVQVHSCNRCKKVPQVDCDIYISLNEEDSIKTCLLSTYCVSSALLGSVDTGASKMPNMPTLDRLPVLVREQPINRAHSPEQDHFVEKIIRPGGSNSLILGSAFCWCSLWAWVQRPETVWTHTWLRHLCKDLSQVWVGVFEGQKEKWLIYSEEKKGKKGWGAGQAVPLGFSRKFALHSNCSGKAWRVLRRAWHLICAFGRSPWSCVESGPERWQYHREVCPLTTTEAQVRDPQWWPN